VRLRGSNSICNLEIEQHIQVKATVALLVDHAFCLSRLIRQHLLMIMASQILSWAHFALVAYAQEIRFPASGTLSPGPGDTPQILQAFEAAGRQPNASDVVIFSRSYNGKAEDWTWRINVTDLAIPDRTSDLGSSSASFARGLHITNTQWQLQWPGSSDTLQSFLSGRDMEVTFNALSVLKPSNVTDAYNAGDKGNCTKLLGNECTQSITKAISEGSTLQILFPACQNTIGINGFSAGSSKSSPRHYD
jgi:hypothetical protein